MQYENIFELLHKGGFTIYVLALCSVFSLKVALDKSIQFRGIHSKISTQILSLVRDYLKAGQYDELVNQLAAMKWKFFGMKYTSPLIAVVTHIVKHKDFDKEDLTESAFGKLDKEVTVYEKGLGVHATLGSITPFIGLFGTVIGIIKSFHALSLQDASNYSSVISGIAEALIATAAGLFVAIPSVMFYNYFTKKLKMELPVLDDAIRETVRLIKK